jgi:hypothetical protein
MQRKKGVTFEMMGAAIDEVLEVAAVDEESGVAIGDWSSATSLAGVW